MKLYAEPKVVPISSKKLDGSVWRQKVAAFRLLPYVTRDDPRFARLTQERVKVTELNEEESDSDY